MPKFREMDCTSAYEVDFSRGDLYSITKYVDKSI